MKPPIGGGGVVFVLYMKDQEEDMKGRLFIWIISIWIMFFEI